MNLYDKLVAVSLGLSRRWPGGDDPYKIMTRLLEECGECAQQVHHFEDTGIKRQKYGEPDPAKFAKEIMDVLRAVMNLITHYHLEAALAETLDQAYRKMLDEGLIERENRQVTQVNLAKKFALFDEYWRPKIAGELNDSYVKLAKLKGEFVWHQHADEDELFLVVRGRLVIKLRDGEIVLMPGEFAVIPRGVEHLPVAEEEVHVLLLEPKTTLNTGNVRGERTVETLDRI